MKKLALLFIAVTILCFSGCEEKAVTINLSEVDTIPLDNIALIPTGESPVKFNTADIPDFGIHDVISVDMSTYSGQVPGEVFPTKVTGDIKECIMVDGEVYFFVSYGSQFVTMVDYDVSIFRYNPTTGENVLLYSYANADVGIMMSNLTVIGGDLFWIESAMDKYNIVMFDTRLQKSEIIFTSQTGIYDLYSDGEFLEWSQIYWSDTSITDVKTMQYKKGTSPQITSENPYSFGENPSLVGVDIAKLDENGYVYFEINDGKKNVIIQTKDSRVDFIGQDSNNIVWIDSTAGKGYDRLLKIYNYRKNTCKTLDLSGCRELRQFYLKDSSLYVAKGFPIDSVYMLDINADKAYCLIDNIGVSSDGYTAVNCSFGQDGSIVIWRYTTKIDDSLVLNGYGSVFYSEPE